MKLFEHENLFVADGRARGSGGSKTNPSACEYVTTSTSGRALGETLFHVSLNTI